ncbi:hypothetical protein KFK09_011011 [Dendrobium nobile]|uniref:Uncharacterized protein n=1 Tax=Dendrobium nobile TaxID=94219 RepID=A0A8T3BDS7_DENNO|nr:hypothetical protein KFK09_011011 [Dendrobium nobile]
MSFGQSSPQNLKSLVCSIPAKVIHNYCSTCGGRNNSNGSIPILSSHIRRATKLIVCSPLTPDISH